MINMLDMFKNNTLLRFMVFMKEIAKEEDANVCNSYVHLTTVRSGCMLCGYNPALREIDIIKLYQ